MEYDDWSRRSITICMSAERKRELADRMGKLRLPAFGHDVQKRVDAPFLGNVALFTMRQYGIIIRRGRKRKDVICIVIVKQSWYGKTQRSQRRSGYYGSNEQGRGMGFRIGVVEGG